MVAILLAAVGFSAVTQVRANELDNTYAGYREQDLIDVLTALSGASQRAEGELAGSRTRDGTCARSPAAERPRWPRPRGPSTPTTSWPVSYP